jgi:hypothetical protein
MERPHETAAIGRAQVGALLPLDVAPQGFDRVEFGRVSGQSFDREPGTVSREISLHDPPAVGRQAIPEQDRPSATEVAMQRAEEVADGRAAVGGRAGLEVQPDAPAVPAKGQRGGDRHALPVVERVSQDGRLPSGRPGAPDDRELREPTFVLEDEPGVPAAGVFFTCGHRSRIHRRIARSSRSRACRAGRWRDQCNFCRSRHTCAGWCRTPVSRSSTVAIRGNVQRSVGNPWASGPWRSAVSSWASCAASSVGLRPNRPAAFNPVLPWACHAWNHRCAATGVTPRARATAACDSPRANHRAASKRRASNAATSLRLAMPQHGIVPDEFINLFGKDH